MTAASTSDLVDRTPGDARQHYTRQRTRYMFSSSNQASSATRRSMVKNCLLQNVSANSWCPRPFDHKQKYAAAQVVSHVVTPDAAPCSRSLQLQHTHARALQAVKATLTVAAQPSEQGKSLLHAITATHARLTRPSIHTAHAPTHHSATAQIVSQSLP